MQIYTYPKGQNIIQNSFFVMASDFDSGMYDTYVIHEEGSNVKYTFKHDRILAHLKSHPNDRDSKPNFAKGEPFIRLRLSIAEK